MPYPGITSETAPFWARGGNVLAGQPTQGFTEPPPRPTTFRTARNRRGGQDRMARKMTRENDVRRMAERRGLRGARSRRRDPTEFDYGRYMLRDTNTRVIVAGTTSTGRTTWSLGDVERYLTRA